MENKTTQHKQVSEVISLYTGLILDSVENSISDPARWGPLRGKLLKLLGDRGLSGKIAEILVGHDSRQGGSL